MAIEKKKNETEGNLEQSFRRDGTVIKRQLRRGQTGGVGSRGGQHGAE